MIKVVCEEKEIEVIDLTEAMKLAKSLDRFVNIIGDNFEIVGKFGVDTVADGKCPDGVDYNWRKRRWWKVKQAGPVTVSKTDWSSNGLEFDSLAFLQDASADGAVPGLLNQVMGVRIPPEAPLKIIDEP